MCRWLATYHFKALNEGYNFVSNLISIEGLQKKLWASKVVEVQISKISRLLIWKSWEKWHLGVTLMGNHKEYYKGEGGGFPQSQAMVSLVSARGSCMHQKCFIYALTNLLFSLCKCIWIIHPLITHLNSHPKTPICLSYPLSVAS